MSAEEDMRRLEELAVSRLLGPLSTDEAEEHAALKRRLKDFDDAAIERFVALAHLAVQPAAEPVPRNLRAAVDQDADEFFGVRHRRSPTAPKALPPAKHAFWITSAGWWVGLAASAVTVFVLVHRETDTRPPNIATIVPSPPPVVVDPEPPRPASPQEDQSKPAKVDDVPADLGAERRAFLASHPHSIRRAWRPGGDPTGERVMGDVIWDVASQSGYMRFVNLRRNEPNAEQYQLWIFDAERSQLYPVDGGVFDVSTRGDEQIIRIQAKLHVGVPLVFAVTVEHPGGVVVSDRSRIAAIANVT